MGTANFTKINFTLNELLHLTARVEMMNKIAYSYQEIVFPRIQSKLEITSKITSPSLPSDEQISVAMKKAQEDALEQAERFGIHLTPDDITICEIGSNDNLMEQILQNEGEDSELDDFDLENDILEDNLVARENENVGENTAERHRNVELMDADGSTRSIPKSTFIWMLSESAGKLSTDRLKRVQGSTHSGAKRIKLSSPNTEPSLFKSDQLQIGAWAMFKLNNDDHQNVAGISEQNLLFVHVTGFRVLDAKGQSKQYKLDYVPIDIGQSQAIPKKVRLELGFDTSSKEIEVLGVYYICNENGILRRKQEQFASKLKNYLVNMKNSIAKKDNVSQSIVYFLPCEYAELSKLIAELNSLAASPHLKIFQYHDIFC